MTGPIKLTFIEQCAVRQVVQLVNDAMAQRERVFRELEAAHGLEARSVPKQYVFADDNLDTLIPILRPEPLSAAEPSTNGRQSIS